MKDSTQKQRYAKRFSAIESSFRVEGMDPSGDPIYEAAKAGVLSGELTPKQALTLVVEQSTKSSKPLPEAAMVTAS